MTAPCIMLVSNKSLEKQHHDNKTFGSEKSSPRQTYPKHYVEGRDRAGRWKSLKVFPTDRVNAADWFYEWGRVEKSNR